MRTLHPLQASDEIATDIRDAAEAGERNRAPGGGWTDMHIIRPPSIGYAKVGFALEAADLALAPIMPRVRRFAATIGSAIGSAERDPYGSYEDDAYCYAHDRGCFIKVDGKEGLVASIWFEANTDDDAGLSLLRRAIETIDRLHPSALADYWLGCSGTVRDVSFMDSYMRRLAGKDGE